MERLADHDAGARSLRLPPGWRRALVVCSILSLLWAMGARILGPSDSWDHRQPRTISYTTDILVNGGHHWILPIEQSRYPATKPPLYNWLAAPMVALIGLSSDLAHKWPSLAALCLCWAVVVRLGRRLDATLPVMKSLGVAELTAFIEGRVTQAEAVATGQQSTRRYAKRQTTWFRHQLPEAKMVSNYPEISF